MEQTDISGLLELLDRPAFFVRGGTVVQANQAARHRLITTGMQVSDLLADAIGAYEEFTGGCLYLSVTTAGISCGASVTRMGDTDVFLLDETEPRLQALALAAQQLRIPLSNVMTLADQMTAGNRQYEKSSEQLQKALYQMHRIICNMSDAGWYREDNAAKMESVNLTAFFDELMEKLDGLTVSAGSILEFTPLNENVIGYADIQMLARAVNNLFSNALKFSPKGSLLQARLTKNGNRLSFCLIDQGESELTQGNLFTRYTREPSIEDSRHGIGLGLAVVRAVAAAHDGTVLIDHPDGKGTRVTLTITVQKSSDSALRTPVNLPVSSYTGGQDPTLTELSEILPAACYKQDI